MKYLGKEKEKKRKPNLFLHALMLMMLLKVE
jgi:hypothetical protein